jgi:hypothetical protein
MFFPDKAAAAAWFGAHHHIEVGEAKARATSQRLEAVLHKRWS